MFDLPDHRAAKRTRALVGDDEAHLAAVADTLRRQVADLTERIDVLRRSPGGRGRAAADRDREIHRLSARLRLLRRFGPDACLGRIVLAGRGGTTYIGRLGLTDDTGRQLLVDWRAPAAEPYFAATHAHPMGLTSRRRYRWELGRITDYSDEVLDPDDQDTPTAPDDESAFIASLGSSRSPRMREVLSTIQADQDAIIRARSRGALVVEGGPGTGKTVVALHRAAYLLYADPQVDQRRGGVLYVGPHRPYLAYLADILPSLGEDGVQTCTLADLVPEGATAGTEVDAEVARLKASADLVQMIEPAVALYEEVPTRSLTLDSPWGEIVLTSADWAEAFGAPDPGTPHNEAPELVWDALVAIVADKITAKIDDELVDGEGGLHEGDLDEDRLRWLLRRDEELTKLVEQSWTVVDAADLVGDLWSVPAYLRRCAPWLDADDRQRLRRPDPQVWTVSDLPLIDAARARLGDPETSRRHRRRAAATAAEREVRADVIQHIVRAADDWGDDVIMLQGRDLQDALIDDDGLPHAGIDPLAGPFAHVIVDEAQELTDAEWQMLLRRCPSRSFTIVGDRAQARHGFSESWSDRLQRVGFGTVRSASLSVNYRTPAEIMAEAAPVITAVIPDANVPTSIRNAGLPVRRGPISDLPGLLDRWLATHAEGTACVIGDPGFVAASRVESLTPTLAKGLEFDLVVLVDPEDWGAGVEGAVDRYVAMTRATQQLVVLARDWRGRDPS